MQRRTVQTPSTRSGREQGWEKAAGRGSGSPLRDSGRTNQRQAIRAAARAAAIAGEGPINSTSEMRNSTPIIDRARNVTPIIAVRLARKIIWFSGGAGTAARSR